MEEARGEKGEPWTEVLSWKPRVFLYHNFLKLNMMLLTPLYVMSLDFRRDPCRGEPEKDNGVLEI
uniref:Uncharacterized protein n=1 Tax=Leersia perrieri TaxID=77586 RepID=A0A0D9WYX2_9ORYZ